MSTELRGTHRPDGWCECPMPSVVTSCCDRPATAVATAGALRALQAGRAGQMVGTLAVLVVAVLDGSRPPLAAVVVGQKSNVRQVQLELAVVLLGRQELDELPHCASSGDRLLGVGTGCLVPTEAEFVICEQNHARLLIGVSIRIGEIQPARELE